MDKKSHQLPIHFSKTLGQWQETHGRHHLPWQQNKEAYGVWLSEIMLQQTQVVTVMAYFQKFLEKFPTIKDLAAAPESEVMALWAGLGYYSRARNLHACAKAIVSVYGGSFPQDSATLQTLPGIGPSTAAAIASTCFNERISIFDGNVKRVVARISGFDKDVSVLGNDRELHSISQASIPKEASEMPRHTQALMDLGATVCTPKAPQCDVCPFSGSCEAQASGRQLQLPVKTKKLVRKRMDSQWLWLSHKGRVWVQPRPAKGIWGGLLSFPTLEAAQLDEILRKHQWDAQPVVSPAIKHVLTHRDWFLTPVKVVLSDEEASALDDSELLTPGQWMDTSELDEYGIPAPLKALLARS